ncbi:RING finger protein 121 [Nymphon striatum]|nr:RING finger protein 121 [Nymphon striatum]
MVFQISCVYHQRHNLFIYLMTLSPVELAKLSPDEKLKYEHKLLHEKHRGHEAMHAEMILILLVVMIVAQIFLIEWKKRHNKSYKMLSLIGLLTVPTLMCVKRGWWRFVIIWCCFSVITAFILKKALSKPILPTTPRLVYKWFYFMYKVSYVLGIIGYCITMASLFGFSLVFNIKPTTATDVGFLFLFYGLYYGVVSLDLSEIATHKMAAHIGYYTETGVPLRVLSPNICAVCGNPIIVTNNKDAIIEKTYKLPCDHVFHEFCIRGWCIVGKKQTCPYCKEKVDLARIFRNLLLDLFLQHFAWQASEESMHYMSFRDLVPNSYMDFDFLKFVYYQFKHKYTKICVEEQMHEVSHFEVLLPVFFKVNNLLHKAQDYHRKKRKYNESATLSITAAKLQDKSQSQRYLNDYSSRI